MHSLIKSNLAIVCVLALAAVGQAQDTHEVSPEQIRVWVQQLDDSRFDVRKSATRQLIGAGGAGIDQIRHVIERDAGLEVQARGLEVLKRLARSDQLEVRDSAQLALESLAGGSRRKIAERAARKLDELKDFRRGIAIAELQRLGADIRYGNESPITIGMSESDLVSVFITDQFQGTEDDIQQLRHLFDLRAVMFEGSKITDRFLEPLGYLEELALLSIKRTSVSDAGIKHLERLAWLGKLSIWYTPITDTSNKILANLRVRELELFGTQQTPEGIAELRQQLLGTPIEYKAGGFLGVGPKNFLPEEGRGGCRVGEVKPNSSADKAGMQVDDVIVGYDGQVVASFEQLKELIARNRVGEQIKIELLRNGKLQHIEATLGAWE